MDYTKVEVEKIKENIEAVKSWLTENMDGMTDPVCVEFFNFQV